MIGRHRERGFVVDFAASTTGPMSWPAAKAGA